MGQVEPTYNHMTSRANPVILEHLGQRYGSDNVCWPIAWLAGSSIQFYTFERTKYCDINTPSGKRPSSITSKSCHIVDYLATPRRIDPHNPVLIPSIQKGFERSYDYVQQQSAFNTIDLDYVWFTGRVWIALELTTFWFRFDTRAIAEDKVCKMNRRQSWRGKEGPHGLLSQIEAARDLNCHHYIMGCVNTPKGVENKILTDGNAYWFNLDKNQVGLLVKGKVPNNAKFDTFGNFLESL